MFYEKGDPRGSFFVGIKIKEMSVFKKYGSGENLVEAGSVFQRY